MLKWMIGAGLAVAMASQASAQESDLSAVFGPLLGKCWSAERDDDGKKIDTHCYRLVESGKSVEVKHFSGSSAGTRTGISRYRWDSASKSIRYNYEGNDGSHSIGTAIPVNGGYDIPDEQYVGASGEEVQGRSRVRFIASGGFMAIAEMRVYGYWKPLFSLQFVASGDAP